MEIHVYTDGGARGNPGIAGYGIVILDQDRKSIFQDSKFLGIKTNNEAEYLALVSALTWIKDNKDKLSIGKILFYSDSELLVRQIAGIYKVKAPNLKPLFALVSNLLLEINLPHSFKSVPREYNSLADKLANQAMDHRL